MAKKSLTDKEFNSLIQAIRHSLDERGYCLGDQLGVLGSCIIDIFLDEKDIDNREATGNFLMGLYRVFLEERHEQDQT